VPGVPPNDTNGVPMADVPGSHDQGAPTDVVAPKIAKQFATAHRIERSIRARDRSAQWFTRPESGVEQFLHIMLRLVQIHCDFLFDNVAFFGDFRRSELGVQKHVLQHIDQLVKSPMACARVKTGGFLTGECVEVATHAFYGLRDFFGGALPGAFEQQVLDEMANAIQWGRLTARTSSDPKPHTYPYHVRHFRRGNPQTVCQTCDLIHGD
jgi:hypothetical protein